MTEEKKKGNITFVRDDAITLIKSNNYDAFVHGCNCFNTFGAGIALQISQHFPDAAHRDRAFSYSGDFEKLGNFSYFDGNKCIIYNAYIQYSTGVNSVEYLAIKNAINNILHHLVNVAYPTKKKLKILLPLIGNGLAGPSHFDNWYLVEKLLLQSTTNGKFLGIEVAYTVVVWNKDMKNIKKIFHPYISNIT